jgi:hypothetical protein
MKHLKSFKRELANTARWAITCKDTAGNCWALVSRGGTVYTVAVEKDETRAFNVMAYTMVSSVYEETLKELAKKDASWWASPLEDYEKGQKPLTLNKKTLESICIALSYGADKLNLN